jgi:hypothetical protein
MELEFASANATSVLAAAFAEEAPASALGTGAAAPATLETLAGSLAFAEVERFDADKTGNWSNSTAAASNI